MSTFMKPRTLPAGNRSFRDQARRSTGGGQQRRGPITGAYNRFQPQEKTALWFAMCPTQTWEFDMYNRETREVEHLADQFYYSYVSHYVARTKRFMQCSAQADRSKPCWGCGVRNAFYDYIRDVEDKTGVKPAGMPPISAGVKFSIAGVMLEHIAKVPAVGADGKARMNRDGKPILNDTPVCTLDRKYADKLKAQGAVTFGLPVHWSIGRFNLDELVALDEELSNRCANCAEHLMAFNAGCPECGDQFQISEDADTALQGQDLAEARLQEFNCTCGYHGPFVPVLLCECGAPAEGHLVDFALRIKMEKVGDNNKQIKLVEVKPLHAFVAKYPAIEAMLQTPLDLPAIFAPTPLEFQKSLIPADMRNDGVNPNPKAKSYEKVAENYELGATESSTDDDVPY